MPWYLVIILALHGQPVGEFQSVQGFDTEAACLAQSDDLIGQLKLALVLQGYPSAEDVDYQAKCEQISEEDKSKSI